MENPFDHPQDRYAQQQQQGGTPGPGQQQQSSSPWNAQNNTSGAPAPPPRPPSNPTGYPQTSYGSYPTYNPGGTAGGAGAQYNTGKNYIVSVANATFFLKILLCLIGYDNPYSGYYDQPAYDNPNSLPTFTGHLISNQQLPTPTAGTYGTENPFLTPQGGHPSLYNDAPTMPTSSSAASGGRYDYAQANEMGFATRPVSSVNPDRYNSPAPLPGSSTSPPTGRKKVQLSDNPTSLVPGFPPTVGSRTSRYGDEEGAAGDAEMALLGPPGGARHGGDRFSVGGFDPGLLGEDDDSNIRCV